MLLQKLTSFRTGSMSLVDLILNCIKQPNLGVSAVAAITAVLITALNGQTAAAAAAAAVGSTAATVTAHRPCLLLTAFS
jgi:uncharacterized ParB-like nuclease family protein